MTLTRQHFELIADTIAGLSVLDDDTTNGQFGGTRLVVAEEFADALAATNPNFDREKFIRRAMGERVGR